MKAFDELTKPELAALSHEDVDKYINYACAEAGIPLLPELPSKPAEPIINPDVTLYEIAGHTVPSMELAELIQAAFNRVVVYNREYSKSCGNFYVYSPSEGSWDDPSKIKPVKAISNDLYNLHKKDIEKYKTEKAEYDRIEKLFKDIKSKRERTETFHWDAYRDAVEWAYTREQIKKQFAEYMKLAENNPEIAWNFLVKANADVETIYPDIKSELPNF